MLGAYKCNHLRRVETNQGGIVMKDIQMVKENTMHYINKMNNRFSAIKWKGCTTGNDVANYYLFPYKLNGEQMFTLETHVLTENPECYVGWDIIRKFGNKFFITKVQGSKEDTWLAVEKAIRLFHKNYIPNNDIFE